MAVGQSSDNGGRNDGGSNNLTITELGGSVVRAARNGNDGDSLALLSPVLVVQVVEVARQAAVEGLVGAEGQQVVLANGETAGVDGTSLRRTIELELEVGGNVTGALLGVVDGLIRQGEDEHSVGSTLSTLLYKSLVFV